jgi:hypothetical protein
MGQEASCHWHKVKSINIRELNSLISIGSAGKPVLLSGFGLLTKDNLPSFIPFNCSTTTCAHASGLTRRQADSSGVTDSQRNDAYQQWFQGTAFPMSVLPCLTFHQLAFRVGYKGCFNTRSVFVFPIIDFYLTTNLSGRKVV